MLYKQNWMESLENYVEEQEKLKKPVQPMIDYFNQLLPGEATELAHKSARRVMRRLYRR